MSPKSNLYGQSTLTSVLEKLQDESRTGVHYVESKSEGNGYQPAA